METNTIIRRTPLVAYPGWVVREYADGTFDASHSKVGLTTGETSFADVVAEVRFIEQAENADFN